MYLTEGEKDAGTLRALGYAAVTASGGGGNFAAKLDLDSARLALSGADVVAIMDKDDTGTRWKEQVAQTLTPFVRSLTFIQAAGEAHDASDAAMSGLEFEILPSESSQPESELKTELTPRAYSLTRLADVEPERPLWLWPGHHPRLLRPQQGAHTGWLVLGCAVVQSNQRSERRVQQAASSGRQTTPKATAGKQEVRQHVVVAVAGLCGSSESGEL